VAHFFKGFRGGLSFGHWSIIRPVSTQIPFFFLVGGGRIPIWNDFFGGPGVDFYPDMD